MLSSTIFLKAERLSGIRVIFIRFRYNREIIELIKAIPGSLWSPKHRAWTVPWSEEQLESLRQQLKVYGPLEIDIRKIRQVDSLGQLSPEAEGQLKMFSDWLSSKRYSPGTVRVYTEAVKDVLRYLRGKRAEEITNEDLVRFNNEYIIKGKLSASFQNQVVSGVKKFFQVVFNRHIDLDSIHRPRREHPLPNILSKEEVKSILESPRNMKHRVMLAITYGCGLRSSEVLHLRPNDIDSNRMLVVIRQAKGKRDRVVPLSEKLLTMLREYFKAFKPEYWLFEGQTPGEQYSSRSFQLVLKQALDRAGIKKPVTLHWLRHSYATHLLESGTDLRYIQELLGHKSSRTTEIYTHVSTRSIQRIKSPFDSL